MLVGADHGAVDHLQGVWNGAALVQGIEHEFPQPGKRPAAELAIYAGPLSELLGQVAPGGAGAGDPENAIRNKAMVGGPAPVGFADGGEKRREERSLLVRHEIACQDDLPRRWHLESRFRHEGNPFCQQDLVVERFRMRMICFSSWV